MRAGARASLREGERKGERVKEKDREGNGSHVWLLDYPVYIIHQDEADWASSTPL